MDVAVVTGLPAASVRPWPGGSPSGAFGWCWPTGVSSAQAAAARPGRYRDTRQEGERQDGLLAAR
jgi:hypothetical protein